MEICWAGNLLPPSYIFEGMRAVVLHGEVRLDYLLTASALNLI